jgi:hypothetical protein
LRPAIAVRLAVALGVMLFICEIALGFVRPPKAAISSVAEANKLVREMKPDSRIGAVNAPHGSVTAYYRGNPQGLFQPADPREAQWVLRSVGGSNVRLVFPPSDPDLVRVDISKSTGTLFDIQLNQPHYQSKANTRYGMTFRARADRPRHVFVGFARNHTPWTGHGLYAKLALTPKWQDFSIDFSTSPDAVDDNARIHFDIGDDSPSVEVSGLQLRSLADGAPVNPETPTDTYAVSYRFDEIGCRGQDNPVPKATGTTRVLLLGNSFVLGEGISDEALVSTQLAMLLNTKSKASDTAAKYEVINCGAAGYGTHEERLFYDLVAAKYMPDVVLLGATWKDDTSPWREKEPRRSGGLESLFYTWRALHGHPNPHEDFSMCVEEIHKLDASVRQKGGRLGVFVFRNNADYSGSTDGGQTWNRLTKAIVNGLQNGGIPVLDVGQALAQGESTELKAHAALGFEPNAPAHAIAARSLASFLQKENLVRP